MINLLLWLTPLLHSAPIVEHLTLTSGLKIEARYLPTEDAFMIGLEDFGSLVSDLELSGPSCTTRIDALQKTCELSLLESQERCGARCIEVEKSWLMEQELLLKTETALEEMRSSRDLWRWVAFGTSVLAFGSASYILISR